MSRRSMMSQNGEDTCDENRQRTCQVRSVEADDRIHYKVLKSIRVREGWREGGNPSEAG